MTRGFSEPPDSIDELAAIFGDRLLTAAGAMRVFESDGVTALAALPKCVVMPLSEAEIVHAVRWCFRHDVPWVARGSGTSLSGGSVPVADGLVIALNRMNRCLRIDPDQRLAVVQPGMINARLSRAAAAYGLHYARSEEHTSELQSQ